MDKEFGGVIVPIMGFSYPIWVFLGTQSTPDLWVWIRSPRWRYGGPVGSNHRVTDLSGFPALGGQLQALHGQLLAGLRGGLLERDINACLFAQDLGGFVGT